MLGQKWELYGQGRVTVGQDSGTFSTLGGTTGEEKHTLSTSEMPNHNHGLLTGSSGKNLWTGNVCGACVPNGSAAFPGFVDKPSSEVGSWGQQYVKTPTNANASQQDYVEKVGGSLSHNNIQPSIVVKRYQRTA